MAEISHPPVLLIGVMTTAVALAPWGRWHTQRGRYANLLCLMVGMVEIFLGLARNGCLPW